MQRVNHRDPQLFFRRQRNIRQIMLRVDMDDIQPAGFDQLDVTFDKQRKTVFPHILLRIRNTRQIDDIGIIIRKLVGVAGKDIAGVSVLFEVVVQHHHRSGLTADSDRKLIREQSYSHALPSVPLRRFPYLSISFYYSMKPKQISTIISCRSRLSPNSGYASAAYSLLISCESRQSCA